MKLLLYILLGTTLLFGCSDNGEHVKSGDSKAAASFNEKASKFLDNNADSALYYSEKAFEVATLAKDIENKANALLLESTALRQQGKLKSSFQQIRKAQKLLEDRSSCDRLKNDVLLQQGQLYVDFGQYDEALNQFLTVSINLEKCKNDELLAECLSHMGLLYYRIGDYKKASAVNAKVIRKLGVSKNSTTRGAYYTLNGYLAAQNGNYLAALASLNKAKDVYKADNDKVRYCNSYLNIAFAHRKNGNFEKAKQAVETSIELSKNINYVQLYVDGLNKLGEIYTKIGAFDKADSILNLGLRKAEKIKDQALLAEYYLHLGALNSAKPDYKKAYYYQKKFQETKDRIFNDQRAFRISDLEVQYETKKIKAKNEELAQESERRKLYSIVLGIFGLMAIGLIVLIVNRNRIRIKFIRQQKELDAERLKKQELVTRQLEIEKELKQKENEELQKENQRKEHELSVVAMHIYQKNESLSQLMEELQSGTTENTNRLKSIIRQNLTLDDDWEKFKIHFDQVHKGFFERISNGFPKLTNQDLRHCSYIRMNLSTKEISRLLNINPTSVQRSRVRLKQKLNLDKSTDLYKYIQQY
ncbi:MAG: hypothetical protein NXI10_04770 [bacterium]|nr:hypothetical protein [bacterium]